MSGSCGDVGNIESFGGCLLYIYGHKEKHPETCWLKATVSLAHNSVGREFGGGSTWHPSSALESHGPLKCWASPLRRLTWQISLRVSLRSERWACAFLHGVGRAPSSTLGTVSSWTLVQISHNRVRKCCYHSKSFSNPQPQILVYSSYKSGPISYGLDKLIG